MPAAVRLGQDGAMVTWGAGESPPIRFAEGRGARIAYQDFGQDEPIVVGVPPLAQNLELAFESPIKRLMFDRFGRFSRWIQFDKRGTGSSDRRVRVPGIDERVDDMRAVMDAAEVDRAHLFGQSEGGPMAILFAVTYPERVQSLTLFGTGARCMPDYDAEELLVVKEVLDRMAEDWGTPESMILPGFAPTAASDPELSDWWPRYERNSADRDSIRELLEINLDIDVAEVLDDVDVPTLVMHRVDDPIVPIELGRAVAAGIRGAKLVELPGVDHFGFAGDMDAWVDEMERFITGTVAPRPSQPNAGPPRIVTLGRFAVLRGETEVPVADWGGRLARTLCKRLVAARGRPVTRDELMDLLWPDESDLAKLGARLSVQLSTVRRVLGGGVIADRTTVALDPAEVTTDLDAFHEAPDDQAIVDSYGGEFLPEDRYDDWTTSVRDEAVARFGNAARRLAGAAIDEGRWDEAAALARRLVESDPYGEDGHRLLILAHDGAGADGDARRAHERWAEAMAELGEVVAPLDEVVANNPRQS
ncbi:MAG: alpha/beta fold hydrolase [Actinomycetota bacterium]